MEKYRKTFVTSDTHGMYKALVQGLERAGFDKKTDRLIHLGDVADRGPHVFECVQELLSIPNLVSLRGNHDDWFLKWMQTGAHPGRTQGGDASIQSYLHYCQERHEPDYMTQAPLLFPEEHVKFFEQQLPYFIEGDRIFVHGGFDRHYLLKDQREPWVYWWDRDLWHEALSYKAMGVGLGYAEKGGKNISTFRIKEPCKEIFIGHTPTMLWDKKEFMQAGPIYNVDTGAGYGNLGRLCVLDVETKEAFYSDKIYDLYPPHDQQFWNG